MISTVPEITENQLPPSDKALWQKAIAAVQNNNAAYSVNLILPVVVNNPGFLEGRKLLRKCQVAGMDKGGKSGGMFGLSIGGGGKGASSKTKNAIKKDPVAGLGEIEKELVAAPTSPELNDLLHTTASQLAMIETAEFALETLHQHAPENVKHLHKLANFYMSYKKFEPAAKVYQTIATQDPTDSEAIKGEKDCMAKASMQSGTQRGADGSLQLKVADDSERIALEQQAKTGLTKEQLAARRDQLIHAYNSNQHDLDTAKSLAETYEQLDDYPNAHAFFSWAFQLSQNDSTIQAKADEMKNKANAKLRRASYPIRLKITSLFL